MNKSASKLSVNDEHSQLGYFEVEPEQSQFYTIGVDVTHRCNMECSNCYSPIRNLPDILKRT